MNFNEIINYSIISDNVTEDLLKTIVDFDVISDATFEFLINKIQKYDKKKIAFCDVLRDYTNKQKDEIFTLLKNKNINFINITSDIEETLYADYLYVFQGSNLIMEGKTIEVLKEEKILKRIGFSLPFTIDLSIQLKLFGIVDTIYSDIDGLVNDLWN